MGEFLYCVLLAAVNNIDNVGIRIAYGVKGIKISPVKCIWISVMTFIISLIFCGIGCVFGGLLNLSVAEALSGAILIASGAFVLLCCGGAFKNSRFELACLLGEYKTADTDGSHDIDLREATLLGAALSINNTGGCLGGGISGLDIMLLSFLSAIFCYISLTAGKYLCVFFTRLKLEYSAAAVSGIVLLLLGVFKIIGLFCGV